VNSLIKAADSAYAWFLKAANLLQSPLLLVIRLYWGWQFFQTGLGKLSSIPKVIGYFTDLGVPAPAFNAHFIALLEVGGGILLLLGLGSRLIAVPLAIDMIVAYVVADREALSSIFSDPGKFYAAAPFTFFCASLVVLFFGPGLFSLDTLIARFRAKRQKQSSVAAH
jgi:putative oxidoreductase